MILLTKADAATDIDVDERRAAALQRGLAVLTLDPRSGDAVGRLAPWCGTGRTVALAGSSGVGKSTLVNTLAGPGQGAPQLTGPVREHDDKGGTPRRRARCTGSRPAAGSSTRPACAR